MAHALARSGALVIGVNIRQYFAGLQEAAARPEAPCQMIAADLETLSHRVQKHLGLSEYLFGAEPQAQRPCEGARRGLHQRCVHLGAGAHRLLLRRNPHHFGR